MMTYTVLALVFGILVWRIILPSMKLGSEKTSAGYGTATTAPPKGNGTVKTAFVVFGAITVLLLLVCWLLWLSQEPGHEQLLQPPSPRAVWEWTKDYWLWVVLILGIPFGLLFIVQKPWAKALQWCLAVVAAGLLFSGLWEEEEPSVPLTLTAPANGDSPRISGPNGHVVSFNGSGYVMHCVYSDGRDEAYPCSSGVGLIEQYVRDVSGKQNTVTYEFIRAK